MCVFLAKRGYLQSISAYPCLMKHLPCDYELSVAGSPFVNHFEHKYNPFIIICVECTVMQRYCANWIEQYFIGEIRRLVILCIWAQSLPTPMSFTKNCFQLDRFSFCIWLWKLYISVFFHPFSYCLLTQLSSLSRLIQLMQKTQSLLTICLCYFLLSIGFFSPLSFFCCCQFISYCIERHKEKKPEFSTWHVD